MVRARFQFNTQYGMLLLLLFIFETKERSLEAPDE